MLSSLEYRILDQLDRDARSSADMIARRLRVSGDSVLYHIEKLQKEKILERCSASIDFSRLGLMLFRVSIRLVKNVKLEAMSELILKIPHVTMIAEMRGDLDFIVWGVAPSLLACDKCHFSIQNAIGKLLAMSSLELILRGTRIGGTLLSCAY
jgi:DNA-binding Lrp family transcriptional regulator